MKTLNFCKFPHLVYVGENTTVKDCMDVIEELKQQLKASRIECEALHAEAHSYLMKLIDNHLDHLE